MSPSTALAAAYLPAVLLVWFALGRCVRRWAFFRTAAGQVALALVSLAVAAMPVEGLPAAKWFVSFIPGLSVPALALLADGIAVHGSRCGFLRPAERSTSFAFALLAGLLLYPSALGLGSFDTYALGWDFSALTIATGVWTLWLIQRRSRLSLVFLLALLGWQAEAAESRNLWDYLVDPMLCLAALAWLPWRCHAAERLRRRGADPRRRRRSPTTEDEFRWAAGKL